MNSSCNFCIATTKDGKLCSRRASCGLGDSDCELFCWQHVKSYGGLYIKGEICKAPKLKHCN